MKEQEILNKINEIITNKKLAVISMLNKFGYYLDDNSSKYDIAYSTIDAIKKKQDFAKEFFSLQFNYLNFTAEDGWDITKPAASNWTVATGGTTPKSTGGGTSENKKIDWAKIINTTTPLLTGLITGLFGKPTGTQAQIVAGQQGDGTNSGSTDSGSTDGDKKEDKGMGAGTIIAISLGGVVVLGLITFLIIKVSK